jgi:Mg2+/Co2+ transporter CorB
MSGIETAVIASSPGRIQQLKAEGSMKANIVLSLLKTKEKVISTLLVLMSISNTVCATLAASLFIGIYGEDLGTIISSTVMSLFIIIFAEVIPKAIGVANAEKISLHVATYLDFTLKVLRPMNYVLESIVRLFCYIFRINLKDTFTGADELRGVIEHQHQEEFEHSIDFFNLLTDMNADVSIPEIDEINVKFNTIVELAEAYLNQEILTTTSINQIKKLAIEEDNPVVEEYMRKMIRKQLVEYAEATSFLDNALLCGDDWYKCKVWNDSLG